MDFFKNKKLLILGGAEIHSKVVRAAKEMGIYTIVIDNLDVSKSPAKQIADEHHLIDIFDVEGIIRFCKENSVDGVINTSLDPCQITQSKVCDALNLPCYGTHNQYLTLTNKTLFKKFCLNNGVDVIEGYSKDDVLNGKAIFPIFIKPVDSRGSRGQSICHNIEEAKEGIKIAESISTNGDVLIEQYLENKQDFMLCYIVIDSEPHLVRVCDRFEGSVVDGLDKVGALALNPSKFTKMYIEKVDKRVMQMIKNLGIKYGPIFLQGFVDGETVRMYDPGLRLPGGNYENLFKHIFGVDIIKMLIEFSLTGKITNTFGIINDDCYQGIDNKTQVQDSEMIDNDGFPVQEYTVHIGEPIYPDPNLKRAENIQMMMDKNYEVWKEIYEKTYKMPLEYANSKRSMLKSPPMASKPLLSPYLGSGKASVLLSLKTMVISCLL